MKLSNYRFPLVKLPSDCQVVLYRKVGFDDCYFQPHLDSLILRNLGMDEDSDEVFDAYYEIMSRRSKKISADHDSIMKQALKAYHELKDEKKKHAGKKK